MTAGLAATDERIRGKKNGTDDKCDAYICQSTFIPDEGSPMINI